MRKPRRKLTLSCTPLEARTNPSFLGPLAAEQLSTMAELGLDAYQSYSQVPVSATGATSYFTELVSPRTFGIDVSALAAVLDSPPKTLALPRPDGGFERFRVFETEILENGAASGIRTWRGVGIDDPYASLAADITVNGFRAQVLSPSGRYAIDPYYHGETGVSVSYFAKDHKDSGGCTCAGCLAATSGLGISPLGSPGGIAPQGPSPVIAIGSTLRTFRLAVAATGEYTAFQGGTVAKAQAAMTTTINRVSGIMEKDFAVKLTLLNLTNIIYTSTSDPYTNGDPGSMITQNQTNLTNNVGSANYDIGHVFGTNSGGLASLGSVGVNSVKAQGVTGSSSPVGDTFDVDYVAHEMGHQFGANHTFNMIDSQRNQSTAFEPGSGSTIMAYAGLGGSDDYVTQGEAYYHVGSIAEIRAHLATIPSVGTSTATGNALPVANAGPNYTIPTGTPFELVGSATETQSEPLSYTWEQYDRSTSGVNLGTYTSTGPLFRSYLPTSNPNRTFPRLTNLLNNTTYNAEVMPTGARTLNFTLTVRDQHPMTGPTGGVVGGISSDDTIITVVSTGASFAVTSPNTAVSYAGLSSQTVTWNVAGTTANGINSANVNILLSTDGGNTFPTVLASNVPNDGSETVTIPNKASTQARIKVQPTNNIFFDISNVNFTITATTVMQVQSTSPAAVLPTGTSTTLDLIFTQAIQASTLAASDLVTSYGTVTGVTMPNSTTARFTIAGLTNEQAFTATMAAGAVTNTTGTGNLAYAGNFSSDSTTQALPAFTSLLPAGSRAFNTSIGGLVNSTTDADEFTFSLDAGQTISASVVPSAGLTPKITLIPASGGSSTITASAAGSAATLANISAATAGTYTLRVEGNGSTTGSYALQAWLNAAPETESLGGASNNTIATAQNIDTVPTNLGGGGLFGVVHGSIDGSSSALAETEPNDAIAAANSLTSSFSTYTGNLYHLGFSGNLNSTTDQDWFNIGALQAGDIITIALMGSPSTGGTQANPLLQLHNSTSTVAVPLQADDDGGTGLDSLIYRYTIPANDTYYLRASSGTSVTGTYSFGVQLENTGTVPSTGGSVFSESAAGNESRGAAQDLSSSWQAISNNATATGTMSTTADVDSYSITLLAGDLLTLIARSTSTLHTKVTLKDSAGTTLRLEDGTSTGPNLDSPLYAYRIPLDGTYIVQVGSASGTGSYALDAFLTTTVAPPVASDFFAITLAAGQVLDLGLEMQTAGAATLELQNAAGTVLATGDSTATNFDRSIRGYAAPSAAVYYARVLGTPSVAYTLAVGLGTGIDAEANNSFATAQPLGTRTRAVGALTTTTDEDWFTFTATAGNTYSLTTTTPYDGANAPGNTLDPRLEVYSPANVLLVGNSNGALDGRNATLSLPITASGTYRVRLTTEASTTGEYGLAIVSAPTPLSVTNVTINSGAAQRSMLTRIDLTFSGNIDPSTLMGVGAITLSKPGVLVQTGATGFNGRILVSPNSGSTNTISLTFDNADGSVFSTAVGYGSLTDGDWTLAIPSLFYNSSGLASIKRLFGDANGDGTVDGGSDFALFQIGNLNATNAVFDFNNDGTIDGGTDFAQFGTRFGRTI